MQKRRFSLAIIVVLHILIIGGSGRLIAESDGVVKTNAAAETDRAAYLDPEQKKQLALAKTLKDHEIVWLDVTYPEKTETIKVLSIAHPPLIPEKQGAILLLHDKEQHADWPEVIRPLRMKLPKEGWYTLSVNLPDETRVKPLPRKLEAKAFDQVILTESLKSKLDSGIRSRNDELEKDPQEAGASDTNPEEGTPEESSPSEQNDETESVDIDLAASQKAPELNKIPYHTRALSHVQKAYEYLQTENYQNIVIIAYRQSTELAIQYIKAHLGEITSPGFALVLIEPSLPESYLIDLSESLGKNFQAPILEIINRGNAQASTEAEYRKLAFQMTGAKSYKQLFLTFNNNEVFDVNLSRRIKSWLEVNAPGMKVGP